MEWLTSPSSCIVCVLYSDSCHMVVTHGRIELRQCSFLLHKIDMEKFVDRREGIPIKEDFIHICSNVQIGMRSFIMPGVTIGEGAFVAAHSTVTKDVPSYTIVGGCPAKVLGTVKQWKSQDETTAK